MSKPLMICVALCWSLFSMFFSSREAQNLTQHSSYGLTRAEQKGRITSLDLLAAHPEHAIDHLCCKGTLMAHVQLGAHQDPHVLFCTADFQPVHSMYWCLVLSLPRCKTLHFTFFELREVSVSLFPACQ